MTTWVYKEEIYYPIPAINLVDWLDQQGKEGWELVQIINAKFEGDPSVKCVFKRSIEE